MSFDPAGTTPGLAPNAQAEPKKYNMRCVDPCDSTEVTEIKMDVAEGVGQRVYRCVKCGRTRSLAVGGAINV